MLVLSFCYGHLTIHELELHEKFFFLKQFVPIFYVLYHNYLQFNPLVGLRLVVLAVYLDVINPADLSIQFSQRLEFSLNLIKPYN